MSISEENQDGNSQPEQSEEEEDEGVSWKRRFLAIVVALFIWIVNAPRAIAGTESTAGLIGALMGSLFAAFVIYLIITRI